MKTVIAASTVESIPIKYLKCSLHFMLIIYLLPIWSMNIFSCIKSFHVGHHLDVIVVNVWWTWNLASLNSVRKTKSNGGFLKNAYFIKNILKDLVHIKEKHHCKKKYIFCMMVTAYKVPVPKRKLEWCQSRTEWILALFKRSLGYLKTWNNCWK